MANESAAKLTEHNTKIIAAAIAQQYAAANPYEAPKEKPNMTDDGRFNGQYRALQADVDNLKNNFENLRGDIENRFAGLSRDIKELGKNLSPDFTRYGTLLGVAAALSIAIIGGFVGLENNSINGSILTLQSSMDKSISRIENQATRTADTLIPRAELENRLRPIGDKVDQAVLVQIVKQYDAEIKALQDQYKDILDKQVSRSEHEQHWKQFDDRLNLISNRIVELGRLTAGTPTNDLISKLQDQFQSFQSKFIAPGTH